MTDQQPKNPIFTEWFPRKPNDDSRAAFEGLEFRWVKGRLVFRVRDGFGTLPGNNKGSHGGPPANEGTDR